MGETEEKTLFCRIPLIPAVKVAFVFTEVLFLSSQLLVFVLDSNKIRTCNVSVVCCQVASLGEVSE